MVLQFLLLIQCYSWLHPLELAVCGALIVASGHSIVYIANNFGGWRGTAGSGVPGLSTHSEYQ